MTRYQQTKARLFISTLRTAYKLALALGLAPDEDRQDAKEWFDEAYGHIRNKDMDWFKGMMNN